MRDSQESPLLKAGKHLIEDLPLSMVLTDPNRPDNPIVYVNRAFERTTGYAASAAIGRNCRFLQGDLKRQKAVDVLRDAVDAREPVGVVLRNVRADGSEFFNHLLIAPVHDEDGNLFAFIGIQTVVKPVEDDAEAENAVDFETTLQEMQHRVKNHLQMVASMIRLQSASADDPAEAFQLLSRRVESLAALYDEFAHPPRANEDRRYDVVSAGGYVGRVASAVSALDGRRDIRLTLDTDPVYMRSERAATLGMLISELLSNALQHAFRGRAEGLVEIRLKQAGGNRVRLIVSDDGSGLGDSDWPESGGTGAGIVRALVRQLDAEMGVSSTSGGTLVTLDFVNDLQSSVEAGGRRRVENGEGVGETIDHDDDGGIRKAICRGD